MLCEVEPQVGGLLHKKLKSSHRRFAAPFANRLFTPPFRFAAAAAVQHSNHPARVAGARGIHMTQYTYVYCVLFRYYRALQSLIQYVLAIAISCAEIQLSTSLGLWDALVATLQ